MRPGETNSVIFYLSIIYTLKVTLIATSPPFSPNVETALLVVVLVLLLLVAAFGAISNDETIISGRADTASSRR